MHTKTFNTIEEAEKFVYDLSKQDVTIDTIISDDETYVVNWVENRKYKAFDGKEYTDEVWVKEDNTLVVVQDLEPEHAKNIIRMILRDRKETAKLINRLSVALMQSAEEESKPKYLH